MKRLIAFLFTFFFVLTLLPRCYAYTPEGAVTREEEEDPGDTIDLGSAAAFLEFAENCTRDVYSQGVVFRLTADIDLSAAHFEGVPYFAGTFLGCGHRIVGLSIAQDGSRQGLFRRVAEGAVVRDLAVSGRVLPGGTRCYVGGIVGENAGRILDCSFSGTVTGLESVGGIAGINLETGEIDQCRFSGSVSAEHQSGGIAGENVGVITRSTNSGSVNTEAIVPESEIKFDLSLLSEDDILDLANIGGIAGDNVGVISACRNTGAVGYKNTAFNVGGIAGKSSGYLTGCENSGLINGRRDVGGIAGQLIPSVSWDLSEDKLKSLTDQLGGLNYLVAKATRHANENAESLVGDLSRINGYTADAIRELEKMVKQGEVNSRRIADSIHIDPSTGTATIDPIKISHLNTDTLTKALVNLTGEASVLSGAVRESFGDLSEDLGKIVRQISGIMGTMSSLLQKSAEGEWIESTDLSADEAYDHDIGAIADCVNYGSVFAEYHAGGSVGTIGFEISFDMDDTLDASRFVTSDAKRNLFAVVRHCSSYSEVQAKHDHAACLIGSMDLGAAVDCVATGACSAEGDYVGGICGESKGTIRGCWSRSVLSGEKYVGGIAGLGDTLEANHCWTHIENATEYAGAVAGWSEGKVSENVYVASSPAGIDNVSFSTQTDPISQQELLALEDLPENFNDLTVRFTVEGETVETLRVPFGGTVETLPEIENDGDRYWKWDDFDREHIYHNIIVSGRYYAPGTTLASEEDPPRFLVEGVFYEGQKLTVIPYEASDEEELLAACTLLVDGYDGELTVHMLSGDAGKLWLVDEAGAYSPVVYRTDGQYIVFHLPNGGSFVYTPAAAIADHSGWLIGGAILLSGLAAVLLIRRKRKKAKSPSSQGIE